MIDPSRDDVVIEEREVDITLPAKGRGMNLPPGETAKFDIHFEVGLEKVVRFDAHVVARTAARRTSAVSLPVNTKCCSRVETTDAA